MSDQENNKEQQVQDLAEEVIQVEWEEVKDIFDIRKYIINVEHNLTSMMLEFEKKKAAMLHRSRELEAALYQAGTKLRAQKGLDEKLTYELQLPTTEGEKAYFVRKVEQN